VPTPRPTARPTSKKKLALPRLPPGGAPVATLPVHPAPVSSSAQLRAIKTQSRHQADAKQTCDKVHVQGAPLITCKADP
jgi:hypothetical protein